MQEEYAGTVVEMGYALANKMILAIRWIACKSIRILITLVKKSRFYKGLCEVTGRINYKTVL